LQTDAFQDGPPRRKDGLEPDDDEDLFAPAIAPTADSHNAVYDPPPVLAIPAEDLPPLVTPAEPGTNFSAPEQVFTGE
jgi:hypothetical protein